VLRFRTTQVEQRVATCARVKSNLENQHRNSRCSFCRTKSAQRSAVFSTPTLITFALRMAYVRGNLNYGVSERKNSRASEVRTDCAREREEEKKSAREGTQRGAPVIYKPLRYSVYWSLRTIALLCFSTFLLPFFSFVTLTFG